MLLAACNPATAEFLDVRKTLQFRLKGSHVAQVVAVPFSTGFNHIQIADEAQYKFERCMQALTRQPGTADAVSLPVYGIGHSLGSLVG